MKKIILPTLILSACFCLADDLPKFEKLKLKNGREFEKVTITEKRPDGISISHDSGTARIRHEDLPADIAKKLGGFDAAAAEKARAEADAKEAAIRAEIDREMAAQELPVKIPDAPEAVTDKDADKKANHAPVKPRDMVSARVVTVNKGHRTVSVSAATNGEPLVVTARYRIATGPTSRSITIQPYGIGSFEFSTISNDYTVTGSINGHVVDTESSRQKSGL